MLKRISITSLYDSEFLFFPRMAASVMSYVGDLLTFVSNGLDLLAAKSLICTRKWKNDRLSVKVKQSIFFLRVLVLV